MRFNAQALAPVLAGNRLSGLQQIAAKALPAMTLRDRNTMQNGISWVARIGRRQPCALDGIVNRFAGEADDGGSEHFAVLFEYIGVTGFDIISHDLLRRISTLPLIDAKSTERGLAVHKHGPDAIEVAMVGNAKLQCHGYPHFQPSMRLRPFLHR